MKWLLLVVVNMIYLTNANWITGNLCWSMPCLNGGSCFGSAYTYLCVCPVNYSGALCEKRLGICQENPCGNRGLCVETGLYSFECRCYFDYMGPLCEEHIPKNDPVVWSSLIPVHTRVLFDILQEAYRAKSNDRSALDFNTDQIDFPTLVSTKGPSSSLSASTSTTQLESNSITRQSETTEAAHIIRAEGIQLENIFPQITTSSTTDGYTQSFTTEVSPTFETIQQDDFKNETTVPMNTTFETIIPTTETISTAQLPLTTEGNMMTVSIEQNQTHYFNLTDDQQSFHTTEQYSTMITSISSEWSSNNSDNHTVDYTTESTSDSTPQMSNNTDLEQFSETTTSQTITNASPETTDSYPTDDSSLYSSESTMALSSIRRDSSFITENSAAEEDVPQSAHHQLLLKLCQQLLSQILPNVTSLSTSAAVEAALSLSSNSPSSGNNSAQALLTWIKEQLDSTTPPTLTTLPPLTTPPLSATSSLSTTSTITILPTATISSTLPSLLIHRKKTPSISLQRMDMDDVLHQMNNNLDDEN